MTKPSLNAHSLPETETRNPASLHFDQLTALQMVRLMNREDAKVPLAVAEVLPQIARTVDLAAAALEREGRLFTMGAGTSGRLAVLDAAELLPTFRLEPGRVVALIAGGPEAMIHSVEGAEDDAAQGRADLAAHNFCRGDVLIAVAASGRTPYALGGLAHAGEVGAPSVALVCAAHSPMAAAAAIAIEVLPGAEVLSGSTRLKSGTAQKMVLNMISTCVMAKLGKVYGNLMVDVRPSNVKLRERAVRIVCEATGEEPAGARELLRSADWEVKTAMVMALVGTDAQHARELLKAADGHVRGALSRADVNLSSQ